MDKKYDFGGWAARNDVLCSDGTTIKRGAFKHCDGAKVPLVWAHDHSRPGKILGHAILKDLPEGTYAYGYFNNSEDARDAKESVVHGDIDSLSIYANKVKYGGSSGREVIHGMIREVSLVLAGADPTAKIDVVLEHDEELGEGALIYCGEKIELVHSEEDVEEEIEHKEPEKEENNMEEKKKKTLADVVNTMNEEQKTAFYAIVGAVAADYEDSKEEDENMKHNLFEGDARETNVLTHDDFKVIMKDAKTLGSLKEAVLAHMEDGVLAHGTEVPQGISGIDYATGSQNYGFNDPDMLFPEYRTLNSGAPEFIKRDTAWVDKFLAKSHHSPFSRIKSIFADLTEDDARARGYFKGNLKKDQVFSLLKRTTDPQTIYKRQKIDRDDTIDIVDFDVVAWIKSEMRGQLNEEIARAALIGDGRLNSSDDKISEDHIRPIATDNDLFTIKVEVNNDADAADFIDACIRGRKGYKGSGKPTMYTTEDMLTDMLLIKDDIGHYLYKSETELATTLRVSEVETVELMEGYKIDGKDVLAIIVNPVDYNFGADKGGAVSLFDDFDIDYNQQKYLIETRCSGALTKPFSAIVVTRKAAGN